LGQIRIRAAADGRVSTIVPSYGRVQIDHGDGYETWYRHLSKIDVAVGQSVMAGDYIGISGDIGSTGSPHLHFEVRLSGIPVDPYGWQGSGVDPYTLDENIWLW
jgi:murein DD-endopeptidase MepM/ murein hydrolase activator NlpD